MTSPAKPRAGVVYAIFFLSGVAGLGYELVWTRMFATGLGHEMPSLLAVVSAFFGGLALGAWLLDARIAASARPGRWYVGLELLIAAWSLLCLWLIPWLNECAAEWIGLAPSVAWHWLVAFLVPFVGILPATFAMGASFPAMERLAARRQGVATSVAGLYAVNTAGAVAGTWVAMLVLAPSLGYRATLMSLAAVNVLCALATLFGPAMGEAARERVDARMVDAPRQRTLCAMAAWTGLLGIGYEIGCIRVLAQSLQNTVYSFAVVLSVYLLGTALGALLYQRVARKREFVRPFATLLQLVFVAGVLGVAVLGVGGDLYERWRAGSGGGPMASILAEALFAVAVLFLPAVAMGATFSHLLQASRTSAGGVGRTLGWNTLGSALAGVLIGVLVLPLLGSRWTLIALAAGYLVLVPWRRVGLAALSPTAGGLLIVLVMPGSLVRVDVPPGARLIDYREGVRAAVSVLEYPGHGRTVKVDNRFSMGGTLHAFGERRQAHLPLLLHGEPANVLFLGVGSGLTAGEATRYPGLTIDAVELLPEVVSVLPQFAPDNRLAELRAQHRLWIADARRFVRAMERQYDVIVADLFHPARDGAGGLFTVEHFRAIRARLRGKGLFCQWLPLHQLDLATLRIIVRTFRQVFPRSACYLGYFNVETPIIALLGFDQVPTYGPGWLQAHTRAQPVRDAVTKVALTSDFTLFGCAMADAGQLAEFAGVGPVATDDLPLVLFRAPWLTVYERGPSHVVLEALLSLWSPPALPFVTTDGADSVQFRDRMTRYIESRDLFLRGRVSQLLGRPDEALERFAASIRASSDCPTAYAVCLQDALQLSADEPERARTILLRLIELKPTDSRLRQLLARLPKR